MSLRANINKHLRRSFASPERGLPTTNDPISSFGSEKQNGPPCKNKKKKKGPTRFSFVFVFISTGKKVKRAAAAAAGAASNKRHYVRHRDVNTWSNRVVVARALMANPDGRENFKKRKRGSGILGGRPGDEREYNYIQAFPTDIYECLLQRRLTTTAGERKRTLCLYSFIRQQLKGSGVGKKLQNNWQKSNVFTWCWNSGWSLGRCHRPARNSWPSHNWRTSWRRPDSFQFRTRGQDTGNIKIKIFNRLVTIRHRFIATNQSGGGQNGPTESVGSDLRVGRTLWRSKSRTTSSFGHGWSNVTWDWTRGDKSCTAVTKTTNNLWIGISKSGQSNRNANREFMTIKKKYQIKIYKLERKMCV